MRPREDEMIDPAIAEQLDAIDATLAGDPVDPRFAELAELALLLAVGRPEGPRPEFAHELDRRVRARFGRVEPADALAAPRGARARRWRLTPAMGAAGTALAAVVVGIAVVAGGGGSNPSSNGGVAAHAATPQNAAVKHSPSVVTSARAGANAGGRGPAASGLPNLPAPDGSATSTTPAAAKSPPAESLPATVVNGAAGTVTTLSPAPIPNGRKITQSSSLQLGAPPNRIDTVAQEVFDVVGAVNGIVDSSNVSSTGGPGASAQFQLRLPSATLSQALSELSRLRYANVIARIDNTQDINSSFVSAEGQIAKAKVALASLRLKLAATTIETQIVGLRAQIAGENATIRQAQASLRSLNRRVDYSHVSVSIQATSGGTTSGGGGFGLHQAGHDALRVLEVSAGVALIALAVLVPIGILAALGWWVGLTLQRRRRERALDLA